MCKLISFLALFCRFLAKIIKQNNFKKYIFTAKGANNEVTELN